MNVLIVEDEAPAVERLQKLLVEAAPAAQVAGITDSIESTVAWLQTHAWPDLILMDIELADGQSFAVFQKVKVDSPVIFTTSYDEYAIQAFKVNSIDYLLKPVTADALRAGIAKITTFAQSFSPASDSQQRIERLVRDLLKPPPEYRERFLVRTGPRYYSIETADVAYFYFSNRTTFLKTWNKDAYTVDYTLDELEDLLPPTVFFRANRQFLVHIRSVQGIHTYFHNKLKLMLKPPVEEPVLVSKERTPEFKKWLGK